MFDGNSPDEGPPQKFRTMPEKGNRLSSLTARQTATEGAELPSGDTSKPTSKRKLTWSKVIPSQIREFQRHILGIGEGHLKPNAAGEEPEVCERSQSRHFCDDSSHFRNGLCKIMRVDERGWWEERNHRRYELLFGL